MDADSSRIESMLRHAAWVRRTASRLTRDAHRAEDLAQDTWAIALASPPSNERNTRGWLGTVLRNAAKSVARGDARRRGREKDSASEESVPPADSMVEEAELAARLAREVQALEEPYRTAIVLVYFEDRSSASIARELGVPDATVRSQVSRGLQRLRERLAHERAHGSGAWIAILAGHAARRAHAGGPLAIATGGTGLLTAMTTKTLLVLTSAAALVAFIAFRWNSDPKSPAGAAGLAPALSASVENLDPGMARQGERLLANTAADVESTKVAPAPSRSTTTSAPSATGSLLAHVKWSNGEAAKDVYVDLICQNDSSHLDWRVSRTDSEGTALLESVLGGPALVRTDRGTMTQIEVISGQLAETEIVIPRGVDVSGTVTDGEVKAVAGASIYLIMGNAWYDVATADANGRFEIRDVESSQFVFARAPGRAPSGLERIEVKPGARVDLALRLEGDGGDVEGIVLDPERNPIGDAIVCVGDGGSWTSGSSSKVHPPGARLRTGTDGRFHAEGISSETIGNRPAGTIPVSARAYGFAPATQSVTLHPGAGTATRIEIRLGRGAILEGVVLGADEKPVPHARVFASAGSARGGYGLESVQTESGDDGKYELSCVPTGEHEVHVESQIGGRAIERATFAEGERRRLDLHLSQGRVIEGHLVDGQGKGLAGWLVDANCTVRHVKWDEDIPAMSWSSSVRTGQDGEFLLHNCPRFEVTLQAFAPGEAGSQPSALLTIPAPPAKDVRFVVPDSKKPTARIRGRMRTKDGSPVPPVELYAHDADLKGSRATKAEIDPSTGEFRVGPLPSGLWKLSLQSDRFLPIKIDPVRLENDEDRDVGAIDLVAGGFVRAQITHREKGDWKRVRLGLLEEENRILYVDLKGTTWKSAPFPSGDEQVVIEIDGKADEHRTLQIRSGEETPLEIVVD